MTAAHAEPMDRPPDPTNPLAAGLRDPAAFEALLDVSLPRLYGYFLARVNGDQSVAEDLMQESYLAALRELRRGVAVAAPMPWLLGIARHKLIDHYAAKRRGFQRTTEWDDEVAETFAEPTDDIAAVADREQVAAALDKLPDAQRLAITLRYLDDLSVPEIATATGRSVHAVESLLARGRIGLRRTLSGDAR